MDNLALILEQELENAVEVKDSSSLHRYILLLTDSMVKENRYAADIREIKSDVRLITESMKQGFEAMDKRFEDANLRFEDVNRRFEDTNKRFEDMNQRFDDMNVRFGDLSKQASRAFTFTNLILGVLVLITVLLKFI